MPYPNTLEEIEAQVEAVLDPRSGKDSLLLTPKSPYSATITNKRLRSINLFHFGKLFTIDSEIKDNAERLRYTACDADISVFLFGADYSAMLESPTHILTAVNHNGVMISEIVCDCNNFSLFTKAEAVLYSHAGPFGDVRVKEFNYESELNLARERYLAAFGKIPISLISYL